MAHKWTLHEVGAELLEGKDKSKIMDIGARFPILLALMQRALDKGGEDLVELLSYLPADVSANRVNGRVKDGIERYTGDDEEEEKPAAKKGKGRGRKAAKEEDAQIIEPEFDAESDEVDYDEMSAVELFKECKKRGIRVEPKKAEKHYITKLKNWDKKNAKPAVAEEDEADDWDDEVVEEAPKKKGKGKAAPKGKPKGKPKKVEVVEEDEDDDDDEDWDI